MLGLIEQVDRGGLANAFDLLATLVENRRSFLENDRDRVLEDLVEAIKDTAAAIRAAA